MGTLLSRFLPDFSTQDGLRQYQWTVFGFVVIHGFLHTTLFMDNMIAHLYFALEIITLIYIFFFAANYTARPLTKLRNQILILLSLATLWATHHLLLPLPNGVPLFSSKEVLLEHATKTLRQNYGEAAIQTVTTTTVAEDGQEETTTITFAPYAGQMATFLGGIGGLGVFIGACFVIEAIFVGMKYSLLAHNEKEKKAKSAAVGTKDTSAADKKVN
ncbi:hypothetical protein FBU30_003582 [Linnemannia zychae]|nr:hypothetical protein FBU30_003582 [Linnemannia zychae]